MAQDSKIQWTHHTFNPWRGCTKVSPGCEHCYAETMSKRNPSVLGEWGPNGKRVIAAESYWRQPLAWDRAAAKAWERHRVFCASLADVFEDRKELHRPRLRLFRLIEATPNLDWLLLTKRPENVMPALKQAAMLDDSEFVTAWYFRSRVPHNVWLGVSVEDQQRADERIPLLLQTPAAVRFLSCEPLLGPISLRNVPGLNKLPAVHAAEGRGHAGIDWVIVGGESGPGSRPFQVEWARSLRDQCKAAGVPFFLKQLGSNPVEPHYQDTRPTTMIHLPMSLRDKKGGDMAEWPADLRIREFPQVEN